MSINWVMLSPSATPPYTPLAHEQTLFTSPPRIGLSISTPAQSQRKQQQQQNPPFSLAHASGTVYLTNRRIIYLPDKASERLKSFAAPILHLHDSHVTAPFFGPNVWTALLQPVPGGGISAPSTGVVELKLTFKEGGAFDFHTRYERVRERLHQAADVARIDDTRSAGQANGVDASNVTLEDLPAYEERSNGPLLSPVMAASAQQQQQQEHQQQLRSQAPQQRQPEPAAAGAAFQPPDEPPPGYEEAQMAGLQDEAERRMREGRQDGGEDRP